MFPLPCLSAVNPTVVTAGIPVPVLPTPVDLEPWLLVMELTEIKPCPIDAVSEIVTGTTA
jgi:hypothetical protein